MDKSDSSKTALDLSFVGTRIKVRYQIQFIIIIIQEYSIYYITYYILGIATRTYLSKLPATALQIIVLGSGHR
jgi:hypothetical protein